VQARWPDGIPLNAADRSAVSGGAGNGAPRTVPTFIADVLATLAVALVLLCRGPGRADSPVTDRMVRWWAAVWLRAVGTRVTVRGFEHVSAATAYVVVASHQSNLDPMVHLQTLPLSLRILVNRELFRIWLLGRAMHAIGMIEVDRDSPTSAGSTRRPPGPWRPVTRCWSTRRARPRPMARSASSKTAPSSSRSPARCRSCLSPSMAPAASGRRGEPQSTAASYA